MRRRVELASCSPQNNLDALVMLASAEAIASLLVVNDSDDLGPDAVRLGATELALAIGNVRAFLERETGVTAKALGISGEGTAWQ